MSIIFLPHGGGPMPLLAEPNHQLLIDYLQGLVAGSDIELDKELDKKPRAILMISAHWEEAQARVTSAAQPGLLFDYYGFDKQAYDIHYPIVGDPQLAQDIIHRLKEAGISAAEDDIRGFDHGTFVPLKLMYPEADIPVVQLSLLSSLDAQAHIDMGKALAALVDEDVLIIGSGFTFHNMKAMSLDPEANRRSDDENSASYKSQAFDTWLQETIADKNLSMAEKEQRLADWQQAPQARFCQPREEHLLPLMVCFGAAMAKESLTVEVGFDDFLLGGKTSGFVWQ
jgi:aromatic ring-opening dioxygenase catalytic subunit (LigB family)